MQYAAVAPRVLFLNQAAALGGSEHGMLDWAPPHRDTSLVLLFTDGPLRERLERLGMAVRVLDGGSAIHRVRRESIVPPVAALRGVARLAREVARLSRDFDLLYANSQKAFIVACAAQLVRRRPILWHLHDVLGAQHFSGSNIRLVVMLGNRVAERVVAVSRAAADSFIAHGGREDKVHVVYAGMDPAPYLAPGEGDIAAARRSLGVGDAPLVGSFSRLSPWKGQHVLLDALARLPGVHALIAGDALFGEDAYARSLHDRARALGVAGRVHFLGNRDDVPLLMRSVDIIVHSPTAPEPFGRVVIEALLAGRPLLAARAGGTLEAIVDGETGLLFEPGDSVALAQCVQRLFADPALGRVVATAGRAFALARYSRDAFVAAIAAHIAEAAGR